MKILKLKYDRLRNEEHFQFQTEFSGLVERFSPVTLNIETVFNAYMASLEKEYVALDVIRKSANTDKIIAADEKREGTTSGLRDTVKGATNHFSPAKRNAANRIEIVINHFGNLNDMPYDEQTASIRTMIDKLHNEYAEDVEILQLGEWLTELQTNNNEFEELMSERYSEGAGKTQLKMKQVRTEVDAAYRKVITRMEALVELNDPEVYIPFINELNIRIEKYNNILAQRKGNNNKPGGED